MAGEAYKGQGELHRLRCIVGGHDGVWQPNANAMPIEKERNMVFGSTSASEASSACYGKLRLGQLIFTRALLTRNSMSSDWISRSHQLISSWCQPAGLECLPP